MLVALNVVKVRGEAEKVFEGRQNKRSVPPSDTEKYLNSYLLVVN